jgi:hypothetical protein
MRLPTMRRAGWIRLRACIGSMACGTVMSGGRSRLRRGYGGRGGEMADASSFAKTSADWTLGFGGGFISLSSD